MRMKKSVEEQVKEFYDKDGWVPVSGELGENRHFRFAKANRGEYGALVTRQPATLLGGVGGTLLIAGAGDLPESHLLAAREFDNVICVDISTRSIEICRKKIGAKGTYHIASILDLPVPDNSVDAVICAHCLYHIDASDQATAVSELIRATRPGGKVLVIYVNPHSPLMLIQRFLKLLRVNRLLGKAKLYMHVFPTSWWRQFGHAGKVEILANDCMSSNQAKLIAPTNYLRSKAWALAHRVQTRNPAIARRLWSYVSIMIHKSE